MLIGHRPVSALVEVDNSIVFVFRTKKLVMDGQMRNVAEQINSTLSPGTDRVVNKQILLFGVASIEPIATLVKATVFLPDGESIAYLTISVRLIFVVGVILAVICMIFSPVFGDIGHALVAVRD